MFATLLALAAAGAAALLALLYYRARDSYKYWKRRGVKGPEPTIFYGNFKTLFTKEDSVTSLAQKLYNQYENEKVVGLFQGSTPVLLVRDPELVKQVLVKDFASFSDRGMRLTNEPLGRNLFSLDGDEWRTLRQKLSPLFSNSKLRQMMPLLNDCTSEYIHYLDKITEEDVPREIRDLNMKYTLKAITSVAFGLDIDTFYEKNSKFIEMAGALFRPRSSLRTIAIIIDSIFPGIFRKLPITFARKDVREFFPELVKKIVQERKGKPKVRRDFMDLMIELKEQGSVPHGGARGGGGELRVTDELIAAQALLFYAAGFETTASSMSYTLYELAWSPAEQERCAAEARALAARHEGRLPLEALGELRALGGALDEALRRHPPAGVLLRQCAADCQLEALGLHLRRGTRLLISATGLHHDPSLFPDPDRFDPDRFGPERKADIRPGTYLPFGEGPRNCIGLRLARAQALLGLAAVLRRYRVSPAAGAPPPARLRPDPAAIVLRPQGGLWLHLQRRTPSD